MDRNRFVELAMQLHAHAAAGKMYARNEFDKEHYTCIDSIAAELLAMDCDELPVLKAKELFEGDDGYLTPKIDTRAAIFNERGEVLLVHDYDGKWAMPGGWCDFDQTIFSNAKKEALEEAGLDVTPYRLVAAHSHRGRNNPNSLYHVIRFFILCRVNSGAFVRNNETSEARYFALDDLPEINTHKGNPEQFRLCLEAREAQTWIPEID